MNPLTHLRRNLVAYVALFLALSAGALRRRREVELGRLEADQDGRRQER